MRGNRRQLCDVCRCRAWERRVICDGIPGRRSPHPTVMSEKTYWRIRRSGDVHLSVGRGLVGGAVAGTLVLLVLAVAKARLSSPGGSGEDLEWFQIMAVIAGLPLSLVWEMATHASERMSNRVAWQAMVLVTVPLNWALLGGLLGLLVAWKEPREDE
jgi:hypothetical protein